MRSSSLAAFALAVCALIPTGPATASASPQPFHPARIAAATAPEVADEGQFIALINDLRAANGLDRLAVHGELTTQARAWTATMAGDGQLRHTGDMSIGITAEWTLLGENVGVHSERDIPRLFRAFVDSPSHLANILEPRFNTIGVGVVHAPDGRTWTTHRFMASPAAAPPPPPPTTAPPPPPTTTAPPLPPPTTAPPPPPPPPPTTAPPSPPSTRRPPTTASRATAPPSTRRPPTTARPNAEATLTSPPTTRRPSTTAGPSAVAAVAQPLSADQPTAPRPSAVPRSAIGTPPPDTTSALAAGQPASPSAAAWPPVVDLAFAAGTGAVRSSADAASESGRDLGTAAPHLAWPVPPEVADGAWAPRPGRRTAVGSAATGAVDAIEGPDDRAVDGLDVELLTQVLIEVTDAGI